jgi:hypothetical protein
MLAVNLIMQVLVYVQEDLMAVDQAIMMAHPLAIGELPEEELLIFVLDLIAYMLV